MTLPSSTLHLLPLLAACAVGADPPPALDAKFIAETGVPERLLAGQVFYVEITMENTGSIDWGPENEKHVVLRAQDPADDETWGTFFITQGQGTCVPAGKRFTFHSWLMAPPAPGEHAFRWRLGKIEGEGYAGKVTLFGEATPLRTISVERRPDEAAAAPAPAHGASSKRVLRFEDFEYAGSFKVPDREGHDLPFSHSGLALRRASDGSRRMFFNYTHPKQALVELEIPPLVKLDEKTGTGALKVAEVKRVWGKLEIAVPRAKLSNARDTIFADGGFCWDEERRTLWWTWWDGYWCGDPPPVLAATRLGEDGTVTHLGSWSVRPGMYKWYWGGVIRLPPGFATRHAPGRVLGVGFGTGYSGTYAGSLGPSLSLIPEPDPKRDEVEAVHALGYYGGESAPRDGRYFIATNDATGASWMGKQPESPTKGTCGSGDLVRSGVFIETPTRHGFIAFVNLQLGRIGYDYGSGYPPRTANCWYFYDPDEMGAAARGERRPSLLPASWTEVPPPGGKDARPSLSDPITGSCFDEDVLYVYTFLTSRGTIHAYRLRSEEAPGSGSRPHAGDGIIHNDAVWRDEAGKEIWSNGGLIVREEGTFYWVGYDTGPGRPWKIDLYSSPDLAGWRFEGTLIRQEGRFARMGWAGRPALLHSKATGKHVIVFEADSPGDWRRHKVGFAAGDRISGKYELVDAVCPEGTRSTGDQSVYQEGDRGYLLATMDRDIEGRKYLNTSLAIFELSPDFLRIERKLFEGFDDVNGDRRVSPRDHSSREASHIFKVDGVYYWFSSGLVGWNSSATMVSTAKDLSGPWSELKVLRTDPPSKDSFNTQHDFVVPVVGSEMTTYVYAGDRYSQWTRRGPGRNIFLPLTWEDGEPVLRWRKDWRIDPSTGRWNEGSGSR